MDMFELAGGARYTKDKKDVVTGNIYVHSLFVSLLRPEGDFLQGDFRDSNWSSEVTLSWKPSSDILGRKLGNNINMPVAENPIPTAEFTRKAAVPRDEPSAGWSGFSSPRRWFRVRRAGTG